MIETIQKWKFPIAFVGTIAIVNALLGLEIAFFMLVGVVTALVQDYIQ